jgi:hypothetical protein
MWLVAESLLSRNGFALRLFGGRSSKTHDI